MVGVVVGVFSCQIRPRDAIVHLPDQDNVLLAAALWAGLEDVDDPIMTTDSLIVGSHSGWELDVVVYIGGTESMIYY